MHDIESPDEFRRRLIESVPRVHFQIARQPSRRRALIETDVEAMQSRRRRKVGAQVKQPDAVEKR